MNHTSRENKDFFVWIVTHLETSPPKAKHPETLQRWWNSARYYIWNVYKVLNVFTSTQMHQNTHAYKPHVCWSLSLQNPIAESLIDFTDPNMNRVASDIFLGEVVLFGLYWFVLVSGWRWCLSWVWSGFSHNEVHGRSSTQRPIRAVCGLHHPEGKTHHTSKSVTQQIIFAQEFYFLFSLTFAFTFKSLYLHFQF